SLSHLTLPPGESNVKGWIEERPQFSVRWAQRFRRVDQSARSKELRQQRRDGLSAQLVEFVETIRRWPSTGPSRGAGVTHSSQRSVDCPIAKISPLPTTKPHDGRHGFSQYLWAFCMGNRRAQAQEKKSFCFPGCTPVRGEGNRKPAVDLPPPFV